jgi:hypothetical protein
VLLLCAVGDIDGNEGGATGVTVVLGEVVGTLEVLDIISLCCFIGECVDVAT